MDFLQFADKHADGLWLLAVIALVCLTVMIGNISDAFRKR